MSLDLMFIIDSTGSMGPWIDACKKEINSIIECIRSKYMNIEIRVSIIAYRDFCDDEHVQEVFPFTEDIAAC